MGVVIGSRALRAPGGPGCAVAAPTLPISTDPRQSPAERRSPSAAAPWIVAACLLAAGLGIWAGHHPARTLWRTSIRGAVRGPVGAAFDDYLTRLEAYGFSGSVLVASHGQVLLNKGYGYADQDTGQPYTAGTLFDIASVSKQFTAAALLKLEQQGKLKVEDPLSRFFPDAPPDKAGITLHQLLTHTAGFIDVLGAEYEPLGRGEMVHRLLATRLLGPPGRRFRYSNAGYSLLAAVVEIVSGQPLGDFMRQQLFLPAGMRHTGFRLPARDRWNLAHGYGLDGPWGTPLDHRWAAGGPYWNLRGNGGVLSTTGDLYLWHLALTGDTVLSAAERRKIVTPYVREGPNTPSRYGYGWSMLHGPSGSRLASHTGGNGVFETDVRRYLDDQVVLVASSNKADFSAVSMGPHLESRYFHEPDPQPPLPIHLDPELLRRCAGRFALPSGEQLRLTVAGPQAGQGHAQGHGLQVWADGPQGLALLLEGQDDEEQDLMKMRSQKVQDAIQGAGHGDYEPLATLFGLPADQVAKPFQATIRLFEHLLGPWTGGRVIGSTSIGGYPYTYAHLTFQRGERLAQYRWTGPTAETVRFPDHPTGYLYLPERLSGATNSPQTIRFGAFDVRTSAIQHLRINLPAKGAPLSLIVETHHGDVPVVWAGE